MKKLTLALAILLGTTVGQSAAAESGQQQTSIQSLYQQSQVNGEKWLSILMRSKALKVYSSDLYEDLLTSWNKAVEIHALIGSDPVKAKQRYSAFSSATYTDAYAEHLAAVAKKYDQIMELKSEADLILTNAITQMKYLDKINAATYLPDEYRELYIDYSTLFAYVEGTAVVDDDDAMGVDIDTEQELFMDNAKAFEARVVVAKYISPLQKQLDSLTEEGLNKKVAISFARTKAEITSASKIIKAHTRDSDVINDALTKAQFEMTRVTNISNEVKLLTNVEDEQYEQIVLNFEDSLLAVSTAINGADLRDKTLSEQTTLIVDAIKQLRDGKEAELLNAKTDTLNEEIAQLNQQVKELTFFNSTQLASKTKTKNTNKQLQSQVKELDKQLMNSKFQIKSMQVQLDTYKQQLQENKQKPKESMLKWSKVE